MKFSCWITYAPDAATVAELRPRHRAYLASLLAQGELVLAGPFADGSGALFVYEAADEAAAMHLIGQDPFFTGGVFAQVLVKPWTAVFCNPSALQPALASAALASS
ncbi:MULTISPECIES: YciI family protein [unclassified Variovorax]|uniref:YciI family protein n=1 Tax=unclassified Variovorax TaxID=663243 RepID=UPI001BD64DF3|nr:MULTISPECIES: YciI family protein [unclassified Variovorax]